MRAAHSDRPPTLFPSSDPHQAAPARIWTRADCEALFHRILGLTHGGGDTAVILRMSSLYNIRWAQNSPTTSEITHASRAIIYRVDDNGSVSTETSSLDDTSLKEVIAAAEKNLSGSSAKMELPATQQYANAPIWSDTTFNATPQRCSDTVYTGVESVQAAERLAFGYLETRAETWAIFNTKGLAAYAAGTAAQYSQTVRDRAGTASGWAGVTQTDWSTLDIAALSARSLQKCLAAANPRMIEPGRYTTILEPQVVGRVFMHGFRLMDYASALTGRGPFAGKTPGTTKIGEQILDARLTVTTDPVDPACPYIPFDENGYPYQRVTWIENGVLKTLGYDVAYARARLNKNQPQPNNYQFRITGGETTIEEMIATTERGVLVTNTDLARPEDEQTGLFSTVTRDGLWLIEQGKITTAVKNMDILESPFFVGNSIEQLGKPERIYGTYWHGKEADLIPTMAFGNLPLVVPPMKVRDFRFAAVSGAV